MNLDSLITIASLVVAVYAILPRVRRLELSIRFGRVGWVLLLVPLALILYLQFYPTFKSLGLTPALGVSRWSINPFNASFLILLLASLCLVVYLSLGRLSIRNIAKLREYVLELSRDKSYPELFSLIESNLIQLTKIYHDDHALSRLRKNLDNRLDTRIPRSARDFLSQMHPNIASSRKRSVFCDVIKLGSFIISLVSPARTKEAEIASDVVQEVFASEGTIRAIAETRPYLALDVLACNFDENYAFIEAYLGFLMEDEKSILYREVSRSKCIDRDDCYLLPARNKLLNFLFSQCSVAERYFVWKPVGESVISYLNELARSPSNDSYLNPVRDFIDTAEGRSRLFAGIHFFDIMVTCALHQNVEWHMWLYYYSDFIDGIEKNLSGSSREWRYGDEWPTRYHYAIYAIVGNLCKWIMTVKGADLSQANIALESSDSTPENGNIPKSSMLALGQIIATLMESSAIDNSFKTSLMDPVFTAYCNLWYSDATRIYAKTLAVAVRKGGLGGRDPSSNYKNSLSEALDGYDKIRYNKDVFVNLKNDLFG